MGKIEEEWRSSVSRRRALVALAGALAGSPLLRAQVDPRPLKDHRRMLGLAEMMTALDFEPVFHANLPRLVCDYTDHGSETEFTMRRNREAFDWVDIVRRPGANITIVNTETEILGTKLKFPILVAPTAQQGPLHPDGERGMYVGASAASAPMLLSNAATQTIESIAAAASGPLWYAAYPAEDVSARRESLVRAQAAGCQAVSLTVDTRSLHYERDLHSRHLGGRGNSLLMPGRTRASWNPYGATDTQQGPWLSWKYIDEIRPLVKRPLLIKGIVTVEDALLAIEHGVDGIIVSNHGGRACDYAPSTLEVLPEIVDAVRGQVPVLIDSGFRRGSDILKALALGAKAVCLGRATRWGLGAFGPAGVQRVLEILQAELVAAMKDAGRPTLASLDRTSVRTHIP